jgi:UPF0716 family protein affecting phage T7 exclusion
VASWADGPDKKLSHPKKTDKKLSHPKKNSVLVMLFIWPNVVSSFVCLLLFSGFLRPDLSVHLLHHVHLALKQTQGKNNNFRTRTPHAKDKEELIA